MKSRARGRSERGGGGEGCVGAGGGQMEREGEDGGVGGGGRRGEAGCMVNRWEQVNPIDPDSCRSSLWPGVRPGTQWREHAVSTANTPEHLPYISICLLGKCRDTAFSIRERISHRKHVDVRNGTVQRKT